MSGAARSAEKTAFVFAGGGSLGAIQVGVLRELVRAGERPDFLVGSSVGALNACFFAGHPHADGVRALEAIWTGLTRKDVFPVTLDSLVKLARGHGSVFQQAGLRRLIETHLPYRHLEEASIPVHVVATSLNGAAVAISSGPAVEAILASAAIPVAFPSVKIAMEELMDGAVAGNTPILTAADMGATRIIVLQTGYACAMVSPARAAIARGLHALTLLVSNQLERDMRLLEDRVTIHIAPHLCPLEVSPFVFDQGAALIARAADATAAWIAAGGLAMPSRPEHVPHRHEVMSTADAPRSPASFDPVTYFTAGSEPERGLPEMQAEWQGRIYHFASAENRARFRADPAAFLPQYGGACAFAMARNMSVRGDPSIYAVIDGKLYFNRDPGVHAAWLRSSRTDILKADTNWTDKRKMDRPS